MRPRKRRTQVSPLFIKVEHYIFGVVKKCNWNMPYPVQSLISNRTRAGLCAFTWAVTVCRRLGDGAGQGAPADLGGTLVELLFLVCKLDLLCVCGGGSKQDRDQYSTQILPTAVVIMTFQAGPNKILYHLHLGNDNQLLHTRIQLLYKHTYCCNTLTRKGYADTLKLELYL